MAFFEIVLLLLILPISFSKADISHKVFYFSGNSLKKIVLESNTIYTLVIPYDNSNFGVSFTFASNYKVEEGYQYFYKGKNISVTNAKDLETSKFKKTNLKCESEKCETDTSDIDGADKTFIFRFIVGSKGNGEKMQIVATAITILIFLFLILLVLSPVIIIIICVVCICCICRRKRKMYDDTILMPLAQTSLV